MQRCAGGRARSDRGSRISLRTRRRPPVYLGGGRSDVPWKRRGRDARSSFHIVCQHEPNSGTERGGNEAQRADDIRGPKADQGGVRSHVSVRPLARRRSGADGSVHRLGALGGEVPRLREKGPGGPNFLSSRCPRVPPVRRGRSRSLRSRQPGRRTA